MARLGSRQIAGYYPTPDHLLPAIARLVAWDPPARTTEVQLIDPCAGDGTAILTLRDLWFDDAPKFQVRFLVAELERERAKALTTNIPHHFGFEPFHGDAFRLLPTTRPHGTLLYLNPPYDTDPDYRRLEARWLDRFSQHLYPGHGLLLFVIPITALPACAPLLAQHFAQLHLFRFPDTDYDVFSQIVVAARRASQPLHQPHVRDRLLAGAAHPDEIPTLTDLDTPVLHVPSNSSISWALHYTAADYDLHSLVQHELRLHEGLPLGLDLQIHELLGARLRTALPPKPAHIALALSAGHFNGHRLEPNNPHRHPPVLAKGVFDRSLLEIGTRSNKEGEITATIEVEQPQLRLSILRLDTYEFLELAVGAHPSDSDDPDDWNVADLLVHYDESLRDLLAEQFPPLHDPADPASALPLPQEKRSPLTIQRHAVITAFKLLALGGNPVFDAEVGTGKTTMSLLVFAGLRDTETRARIEAGLARQNLPARLPAARRALIVCPPHLLSSWQDQIDAVFHDVRSVIVRSIKDLETDADLYILSRETAKLGHAFGDHREARHYLRQIEGILPTD